MNGQIFSLNNKKRTQEKVVRLPTNIYHNLFLWHDVRSNKYVAIISTLILEKKAHENEVK